MKKQLLFIWFRNIFKCVKVNENVLNFFYELNSSYLDLYFLTNLQCKYLLN